MIYRKISLLVCSDIQTVLNYFQVTPSNVTNSAPENCSSSALPRQRRSKIFHALIKNRNWTANKMFVNQHNRIC